MRIVVYFFLIIKSISSEIIETWKTFDNWNPEVSATGGGNNEFQQYYLHPEAARLINGTLNLKPIFEKSDLREDLNLYSYGCTNNWNNGCYSKGSMHWNKGELHYINNKPIPVGGKRTKPFISTKLVSKQKFGYGKLDVEFKLPKGNFLWPAIWMLPATKKIWPIGGEIDLMESMGNEIGSGYSMNYRTVSSALHYGYNESLFPILFTPFAEKIQEETFDRYNLDNYWHNITLIRQPDNLIIKVDNTETLNCDKLFRAAARKQSSNSLYRQELLKNGYKAGYYKYARMMGKYIPDFIFDNAVYDAPFNENFNLIINLAIGGDFFGDSMNSGENEVKPPWGSIENGSHPAVQFLKNMNEWFDWGHKQKENDENNVCILPAKECIKDNLPCDNNKKCYLEDEKHLAYRRPDIDDKTMFKIKNIYFEEYNLN